MLPSGPGGMLFAEYDFQDQNINWAGDSRAPAANNGDYEIRTSWVTGSIQYMFNRAWGLQLDVPYENRYFRTTGAAPGNPIVSFKYGDLGDIRLQGIYTGFSPDMSAGITYGLKLPTGNSTYNDAYGDVDRDSEIGTGSTDLLLGGFFRHNLAGVKGLGWYAQAAFDLPMLTRDSYRPGVEVDAAAGFYYRGWSVGKVKITPVAQVIPSERTSDSGANAAYDLNGKPQSGYQRVLLSPGIEFDVHPVTIYADVEFPVYEHVSGNQLVAPELFKVVVSYMF